VNEKFVDIPGWKGLYQISNLGRVKSLARPLFNGAGYFKSKEQILKTSKNINGYLSLRLCGSGERYKVDVSRLMKLAFFNNSKLEIDHINGDKTDNRLDNLRLCTHSQNHFNIKKAGRCSSRFKGVYFIKKTNRWCARITVKGKTYRLGNFCTEEDAAKAYDVEAKKRCGGFAVLNLSSEKS